ncbi:bile acid:sodium symporter [Streptomyces sp. NPDC094032]|uniref:bile acid:sodium symporter family protein n=1 Tax=Streptomyces sp. NPDC094032 TaxID=3155308 RepID=UPI003316C4FB
MILSRVLAFAQRRLLGLMLGCYALAAVLPGPGEALRGLGAPLPGGSLRITLPTVLLALMVFNAGLGVRVADLRAVARRPLRSVLGVAANALLPLAVLPLAALVVSLWPDAAEAEGLVVGLMLVLAMPIAGGAASWAQIAGGNMPLVVSTVIGSTLLSPLTVPATLYVAGRVVGPAGIGALDDTATIDGIARTGAGTFAIVAVVLPCLAGMGARAALGEPAVRRALPTVKAVNLLNTLLLCYVNATGALGRALAHPDPDLLVMAPCAAAVVCFLGFRCGRWASGRTRCDLPDSISLTLATGMNNSSAAAALAATWFAQRPQVLLPILAYSLFQKVAAQTAARPRGRR